MKKIYISGPITDTPGFGKNFAEAEAMLKAQDYQVVNPATLPHNHGHSWLEYMVEDLKALLDCGALYMLKNWGHSQGACVEKSLAEDLGLEIFYQ